MKKQSGYSKHLIAAAASMFAMQPAVVQAFDAEPSATGGGSAAAPATTLEEVVVTAVARPVNRLDSSVSTSSLDLDSALQLAPRSTEELFRALPGIRSESSGGEGNANITIRGIPLATGGSKYLQLWEDGLPVLEYGDMNFANADNFIRYDGSISRIESVRGGSASTFASDSPGGVINFISNTGEREGGSIGESVGIDYSDYRTDFSYGGKINDTLNYHIGGYYRTGEGTRYTGFNGQNGGQIKANLTKRIEGGYIRVFLKHLDDRVSTYLPSPVLYKGDGSFGAVPGYDASRETLYSSYQTQINTYDAYGNPTSRKLTDGIHAKVSAFGLEFDRNIGEGFHLNNKFRTSSIGGGFISPFTAGVGDAQTLADSIAKSTGSTVVLGQGPDAGKAYNGLAFQNLLFDTTFNNVGLTVDDLKLSRSFGPVNVTAGFYMAHQNIDITWNSWQFLLETVGRDPKGLAITSPAGVAVSNNNGLYNPGLLSWAWDLGYDTTAPYINFGGDLDKFTWDASLRFDTVKARGTLYQSKTSTPVDYNRDGTISPGYETTGAAFVGGGDPSGRVNYTADNLEYSLGGSYRLDRRSSVFARYSEGARFSADRLLQIAGALNADGSLSSTAKGYDTVKQLEAGYKYKNRGLSLYPTAFYTKTDETNAEITTGQTFLRSYTAYGVELEGSYQLLKTGFQLGGNLTYTHARIDKDQVNPISVGNKPRRQADLIWTISPEYRAERWGAGLALQGSTAYFLSDAVDQGSSAALKQNAYTIVNAFASYSVTPALSLSLSANNLFDSFVVTEAEEGTAAAGAYVRARPLSGRTILSAVKYEF